MKLLVLLMMIVSSFTFGEVNDSIKSLKKQEKENIELKVEEIEEQTNISFYLDYSKEKDIPQLKEMEKSVIINFVKLNSDTLKVKINFTQDINIENSLGELEKTLDNLEEFLLEGEIERYSIELLESINQVLLKVEEEAKEEKTSEESSKSTYKILLMLLIIGLVFFGKKKLKR